MSIAKFEYEITAQGSITARGSADEDSRRLRVVHDREKVNLPAAERAVRDLLLALRGVQATGSRTITSSVHGVLREDGRSRQEFFTLIRGS